MELKRMTTFFITAVLSFVFGHLPLVPYVHAGMIPTSTVVLELGKSQDRDKVASFLEREDVRKELMKFGVSSEEASQRLASLSDAEIKNLAGKVDQTVAGGDVIVISLTTVLLIVIILLLIGKL